MPLSMGATDSLNQGWATFFVSRATLRTNLVYAGHYKYTEDIFIDKTMFFCQSLENKYIKGHF